MQPRVGADGGTASIGEILTSFRRHRPIVVADFESARVAQWREAGIDVHIIPQSAFRGIRKDPIGTVASYWRYRRAIIRLVRESGAKVIHANDPLALQLALPAAKATGAAIAFNVRDTIDPARKPPRRRYELLFAATDHVFYLSQDMADRWADIAPNAKRACSVTYSIVDRARFVPTPIPADTPPVVLVSGLVRPKKGQLEFLRNVAPALAAEGVSIWIAGDFDPSASPYMAACAEAAAPLGERVRFLGYRSDVPDLMRKSTVVAVASRYEGLVRAMIEGMSCARPVVSFDISSARELLEEKSGGAGSVVSFGDYPAMADAILAFCNDPERASKAGRKGQETASRLFAPEKVVEQYERVYDELEERSGGAASR